MKPRRTPDSNKVFRLTGGTEDNDLWLEQTVATEEDFVEGDPAIGMPLLRSVWELDEEERARIAAGGNIRLTVIGEGHPPVTLAVVDTPLGKGPG